jgi:hypothetical protein
VSERNKQEMEQQLFIFFNEKWKMESEKMESETLAVTHPSWHKNTIHIKIFLVLKNRCYKKNLYFYSKHEKKISSHKVNKPKKIIN